MRTAIIVIGVALMGAGAASAQAADFNAPRAERVPFADLNLASSAGLAQLDRRIEGAVERVCTNGDTGDAGGRTRYRNCVDTAVVDAKRQRNRILHVRGLISPIKVAALDTARN